MKLFFQLGAVVLATLLVSSARAATISLNYTALISSSGTIGDVSGIPNILAGITNGVTEISGSLVYDTAQAGTQISNEFGDFGQYAAEAFIVVLPSMTFNLPGNAFDISVRDNVNFGFGLNDQFLAQTDTAIDAFGHRQVAALILGNAAPEILGSTALPADLDLADFPSRQFTFNYDRLSPGPTFQDAIYLQGTITSLEVVNVPEPSTLSLSALALLAAACRDRRSFRQFLVRSAARLFFWV